MSKWKGHLYVNIYDQTDKEIEKGQLPTWTFYIPAHTEPGLQKASAVFPRAKRNPGGHKYKDTAPRRPSRHRTSEQFQVGSFIPSDRGEIIGALSTTKLEAHDPEAQTDDDPHTQYNAYPQIFVNKGLRVLDNLGPIMTWDAKEVRRLQEQPYKGKHWKLNFKERSLTIFADPDDGGEKHFYRYGKKGECVATEKGLCAGCVRRAKERSKTNHREGQPLGRPKFQRQRQLRHFDDSETEVDESGSEPAYLDSSYQEVRPKPQVNRSIRRPPRIVGLADIKNPKPPGAPKIGPMSQRPQQQKPQLGRQQREQWVQQGSDLDYLEAREIQKELQYQQQLQMQQQVQQRSVPHLAHPKPQRPVTMLLHQDENMDLSHVDGGGLHGYEEEDEEEPEDFVYGGGGLNVYKAGAKDKGKAPKYQYDEYFR